MKFNKNKKKMSFIYNKMYKNPIKKNHQKLKKFIERKKMNAKFIIPNNKFIQHQKKKILRIYKQVDQNLLKLVHLKVKEVKDKMSYKKNRILPK